MPTSMPPNGSPWQFSPSAGISSNSSAFTSGNPTNAPDGTQVAFIQGTGSMSQSVYMNAGVYSLTFQAAQRAGAGNKHSQELQVLVDGSPVGTATPNSGYYGLYQTSIFTVTTTGPHTVAFDGLNPQGGDNTAFVDEVAITGAGSSINDGSFEWPEMPGLAGSAYQYAPNGSPWQFSTGAGVGANGSAFTAGNPSAPEGIQVAFLQGNGNMIQTIDMNAGVYSLSFEAAQRGAANKYSQEIQVLVDGSPVGTVTPVNTDYTSYRTSIFSLTAGLHTVEFAGLNPQGGDNTAFVDDVTINAASSSINDGNFEMPALAAGTFQYTPGGSPWQFSGGAGVSGNGSSFTCGNPKTPDGTQVAFLQTSGTISESVYMDTGTYDLTFLAAQRRGWQ